MLVTLLTILYSEILWYKYFVVFLWETFQNVRRENGKPFQTETMNKKMIWTAKDFTDNRLDQNLLNTDCQGRNETNQEALCPSQTFTHVSLCLIYSFTRHFRLLGIETGGWRGGDR